MRDIVINLEFLKYLNILALKQNSLIHKTRTDSLEIMDVLFEILKGDLMHQIYNYDDKLRYEVLLYIRKISVIREKETEFLSTMDLNKVEDEIDNKLKAKNINLYTSNSLMDNYEIAQLSYAMIEGYTILVQLFIKELELTSNILNILRRCKAYENIFDTNLKKFIASSNYFCTSRNSLFNIILISIDGILKSSQVDTIKTIENSIEVYLAEICATDKAVTAKNITS